MAPGSRAERVEVQREELAGWGRNVTRQTANEKGWIEGWGVFSLDPAPFQVRWAAP